MIEGFKRGAAGVLCAVLVACGGGGGDSGPAAPQQPATPSAATANITSADFASQSDGAARSAKSSFSSLSVILGGDVSVNGANDRAQAFQTTTQRLAASVLLARRDPNRAFALAVTTQTQPCDTGNLLFTINEASTTANTVGDSVTVTSQSCVVGGQAVSGSLQLVLTAYSETASAASGGLRLSFNSFGVPALTLNGTVAATFNVNASTEALQLTFQGLTATSGGTSLQWFHTVNDTYTASNGTETVSFAGFVGVNGGYVRFDQVTPFVLNAAGDPVSGVLQITGANGGRVRIVAGSTRFNYEFYAPGNSGSTPDATAAGLAY